jgi:predicted dehydrogenase
MGIIGAGHWAVENHIPVLKSFEDVEVVAVCRIGHDQLRKVQQRFDIPFATEDYRELLALNNLDGVVVSSPHNLHYEHAAAALTSGRHVLCEKPMALSAADAENLASLAESRKLHFVIPYGWSFTDYATEARKRMARGDIGRIQHVLCHMSSALRDLLSGEGAWFATESFFVPEMQTWSAPEAGGGYAHGQLTHALGLLFCITNLEPVEVFAFLGPCKTGVDITNAITCLFSNGATGVLSGAGLNPPSCPDQVDIRLFGSEGIMLLDIERPRLQVSRYDGCNFSMKLNHEPGEYSCVAPLRVLIDLISGKTVENPASARLGTRVVEVIDAAFRSAKSGRVVRCRTMNQSDAGVLSNFA